MTPTGDDQVADSLKIELEEEKFLAEQRQSKRTATGVVGTSSGSHETEPSQTTE